MQTWRRAASVAGIPTCACGCVVTALAIALSACDTGVVVMPVGPSTPSVVSASIGYPITRPAPAFVGYGCQVILHAVPAFDIIVVASKPVEFHHVTIRLIGGSHVGGPMITVPRADLNARFGTTLIGAGTTRTFAFRPSSPCVESHSRPVAADLTFLDSAGALHSITAGRP